MLTTVAQVAALVLNIALSLLCVEVALGLLCNVDWILSLVFGRHGG